MLAASLLLLLALGALTVAAQETIRIDFRNYIPEVLDAPVFYPDGITRIAFNANADYRPRARLYYSTVVNGVFLTPDQRWCEFQGATNAGYWVP